MADATTFSSSFPLFEKNKQTNGALVKMMTVMNLLSFVMEHLSCSLHILSFCLTVCGAVSCRDPIPEGFPSLTPFHPFLGASSLIPLRVHASIFTRIYCAFHYNLELLEGKKPYPCKCKSIPLFVIAGVMPSGLCKQWRKVMELTI